MKARSRNRPQKPLLTHHLLTRLALSLSLLGIAVPAQAEGSRTLYPAGGPATATRANLEWRDDIYGGLVKRRTLLKVFANQDEYILLGSTTVGVNSGDISVFNPGRVTGAIGNESIPATADFKCTSQPGKGIITSRTQELAGPKSVSGTGNPSSYTPCFYKAPATGVYDIVFYGPDGPGRINNNGPTGDLDIRDLTTRPNNFNANQGTTIAAWDVTVRGSDPNSTTDLNGRLFAYYLSLFTGNNGRPLYFPIYPITNDGYQYRVTLRGTDPNGFLVYGNEVGFFDSDGKTPLYHDVIGQDGQISNPDGGVKLAYPQFATFFNPLDPTVLSNIALYNADGTSAGLGIPGSPIAPSISGLSFSGTVANDTSLIGTGGKFTFTSGNQGTYQIVISRDGVNFDPTNPNNRVLRGRVPAGGPQMVNWDGKDNSGTSFPTGKNYPVEASVRSGEYHFPLLDAENNFFGGPTIQLISPAITNPLGNFNAFYDDRGYKTINGTAVGTIGTALCGINPPNPPASNQITGFNTNANDRAFGQSGNTGNPNTRCTGSFGDTKGLDLWTYFPAAASTTKVNIVAAAKLGVAKVAGTLVNNNNGTYTLPFTMTVQNYGSEALKNVQVTEDLLTAFAPLAPADISVSAPIVTITTPGSGSPSTNLTSAGASFTGKGSTGNTGGVNNLLGGGAGSILATGATATITFNVTFKPGTTTNTFNNTVTAIGTSVSSNTTVTDASANGTDPDNTPGGGTANNDNDPTNNTSPTPVNYPRIGLAKTVTGSVKQANGSYNISFSIKLKNYGSESLTGVQMTDDLLSTFTPLAAGNITIVTPPSLTITTPGTAIPTGANTALTANASFTGIGGASNSGGVNNLLSGTNVLAQGAEATVTFTINVQPNGLPGPFNNLAQGSGTGAATGAITNDDSQDGTDPDSTASGSPGNNGDGNPGNNTTPTPVIFLVNSPPNVRLVKRVTAIAATSLTGFNDVTTGANAADDNAAGWPSLTYLQGAFDTTQIPAANQPKPNDEVEYTIYFLSDGGVDAKNVAICDYIPTASTYVPNSLQLVVGTGTPTAISDVTGGSDTDGGFYPTSTTLFPPACTGTNNGNGAVLVNVGDVFKSTGAGTPTNSYGLIRFRAKVK